jgi:hypothetical protein
VCGSDSRKLSSDKARHRRLVLLIAFEKMVLPVLDDFWVLVNKLSFSGNLEDTEPGPVVNLRVEDYYRSGKQYLLRLRRKAAKEKELPVHHKLEELLDRYLKATGLEKEPELLCSRPPWAKTRKYRAGRSCAPMPRTFLKDGSNKLGCRRTIRLTHSGRPALRIFWKMAAPLKPSNGSPATPTAGQPSSTTSRSERTARGYGEDSVLRCSLGLGGVLHQSKEHKNRMRGSLARITCNA